MASTEETDVFAVLFLLTVWKCLFNQLKCVMVGNLGITFPSISGRGTYGGN